MTRLASAIALLGIVLRVLLPALHTHEHGPHGAAAQASSATVAACSCGLSHAMPAAPTQERDGDSNDAAAEAHLCLACAIEEGTPANNPPAPDLQIARSHPGMRELPTAKDVFAASLVRLPAPRAPPHSAS